MQKDKNEFDKGMMESWNLMMKICKMTYGETKKVFGKDIGTLFDVLNNFTPQEAIKRMQESEV